MRFHPGIFGKKAGRGIAGMTFAITQKDGKSAKNAFDR
jgi:hypothetical protein